MFDFYSGLALFIGIVIIVLIIICIICSNYNNIYIESNKGKERFLVI